MTPIAIIIAAVILALTAAFMFRWELQSGVVRLDRWTGTVSVCSSKEESGPLECESRSLNVEGLTPLPKQ
jgi:hypothetical protein